MIWSVAVPLAACALLGAFWGRALALPLLPLVAAALIGAVIAGVHHAEVVAARVGEPFGTLILALAVTIIEVSLIVALMVAGGASANALVRDTVFATVMIICNGVIGLCLLFGAMRHHTLDFRVDGTTPALTGSRVVCSAMASAPAMSISSPWG